ncbi:MAG: GNAT family N-acetyltransferase [Pseudomonadota bacterium]|nr:GNAT family N-acetyltransferase [Pseudomonadota bacterium]
MNPEIAWQWSRFADLAPHALYAALRARSEVFVVEQRCAFLELDNADQDAWHLLGWVERGGTKVLAAYLRLLEPGARFAEASIGRVLTTSEFRRSGAGRALMCEGVRKSAELYSAHGIRIGAQRYLEKFYGAFGFMPASDPYLEDGIAHIQMLRPADAAQ